MLELKKIEVDWDAKKVNYKPMKEIGTNNEIPHEYLNCFHRCNLDVVERSDKCGFNPKKTKD